MANRIKNYEINYNILSNASQAAESFAALLTYVEKLSGKDPSTGLARGLTKLNGEINQVVNSVNRLKTAFSEIRPQIDMNGFRSQIGQMQRAVAEFASQTRNIMRMALSGSDKQFSKARGVMMGGNIFDAASLRHFEEELRRIPQKIAEAEQAAQKARDAYNSFLSTHQGPARYPGQTKPEDMAAYAAADKNREKALEREWKEKEKALKALKERQENYQRQAYNLRAQLSSEETRPLPGSRLEMPPGLKKAAELIPRWEKEHEKARKLALAKRAELAGKPTIPVKAPQPTWWGWQNGMLVPIMQEYDEAVRSNKENAAEAAKRNFMGSQPFRNLNFDKEYDKYRAYLKYKDEYGRWMRAGKPQIPPYSQTEEYQKYRRSLKRLRAAYNAQRQLNVFRKQVAAQTAAAAAAESAATGGGPLPPILGLQPQVIEQAFTGKLTLVPDIATAKTAIAAETFNANLKLLPMISDLQTKLNAEKFTVNVTPQVAKTRGGKTKGAATGTLGALQEEINALQNTAKAPITVGTKLDRGGLLGRAQSGYQTLQALASRHPITYRLTHDGSGGLSLNQALSQLSQLAKARPVLFRMEHDGSGGFVLSQVIGRLQTLAAQKPIMISVQASAANVEAMIKAALSAKSTAVKSIPISLKPKVGELTKSIKSALTGAAGKSRSFFIDVKARTGNLTSSINKVLKGKTFTINAKLNTTNLDKVGLLERLQQVWAKLPRTGNRTYTVNLKATGLENISRIERIIALVNSLPASKTKNYNINAGTNAPRNTAPGGKSVQNTNLYGGRGINGGRVYGGKNNDFYTRARAWAYPFTGNTSFGARTPAAYEMMKGMGMMMGVGGAMSIIGSSFSDAAGYQNTMETAKAILRDNYKGSNFNLDYNSMVRVVRDVAMRTKFTAPEAADAARFMAMAGLDIPMIKSAIAPIADVAAISDSDLGEVADKMTNIMTEFKVSPSKMRNLADMMTKTFTSTNTDMMMLAESLQYAGPMAFASGQSLAETLAMIGIMGNSGIQASMAGTTMRMMLQNIYNPNKKQAAFMESIGLKTRDENGRRRSLYSILQDVARATGADDTKNAVENLLSSKDEQNGIDTFDAASKLFRVTAAAGGASLLGNIDKVGNLIEQIQSANGNSRAVSLAKQNTVSGLWAQTKSAFTEAVVKVFENSDMQKYLKNTLGGIIDYLKQPEFIKTMRDLFDLIKGIVSVLGVFVGWWIKLYQAFPGITKWVMLMQAFFTQIGHLMTPFVQLIGLVSTFGRTIAGVLGLNMARTAAAGVAARGVASGSSMLGSAALVGGLSVKEAIDKKNLEIVKWQRKQWALQNTYLAAPGHFWAMAYTNPERVAMRSRAGIRAEQMVARKTAELNVMRQAEALGLGYMYANGRNPRSKEIMAEWARRQSVATQNKFERRVAHLKPNPNLLTRAARQGRLSWGNLGRGVGTAFTAAFTANTISQVFGSVLSAIRGGLTSIALGAARALGFLVNPATLAAGAIGSLAIVVGKSIYDFNKQNKEWQEGIKRSGVQFRDELQNVSGDNNSLKDIFEHISTINVNSANVNINEGEINKMAPRISEDENLKDIYGALQGKIYDIIDGTLGKSETLIKGVSADTFKEAYRQYVEPMKGNLPNLPSYDQYLAYVESSLTTNRNQPLAAAAVVQAIIGQKGTQSSSFAKAESDILKIASEYSALPISDQLAQYEEYKRQLTEIANIFNPKNHPNVVKISSANYQQALTGSPGQYYEYWLSAYNNIVKYIEDSPALKAVEAIHTLNSGVQEKSEQWWTAMVDLIGSMEVPGDEYKNLTNFTIPTKNGQIDFDLLTAKISQTGEKLNNDVGTYMEWVSKIYDIIFSDQGLAQQLNGINFPTKEEILNHLFKNIGGTTGWVNNLFNLNAIWVKNGIRAFTNANNGGANQPALGAGGAAVNNGGADPNANKPGYEYSIVQGKWVPKAPKTTAYNSGTLNNGYENSYAMNGPRPTQVIVNIDKLMDADMKIASDAEERQLASMMEGKIEQALDILRGQIVMGIQKGDYNIS